MVSALPLIAGTIIGASVVGAFYELRTRKLRQLILEVYITGCWGREDLSPAEHDRLGDALIDAAEGRRFRLLGLPFPGAQDSPNG